MVKLLVFDTETTGLPPIRIGEKHYLVEEYFREWAYIVQLSYVVFDTETKETNVIDDYIVLPEKFTTPAFINSAHETTRNAIIAGQNAETRIHMNEALDKFMEYFRLSDVVAAHNSNFDLDMLLAESLRNGRRDMFDDLITVNNQNNKIYCTGCKATNVIKICKSYNCKKRPIQYKMPQLKQAHYRMFGYAPTEALLHNALIDVVACLRVFYRLWFQGVHFDLIDPNTPLCGVGEPDIYLTLKDAMPDNQIVQIINNYTPMGVDPSGIGSNTLMNCDTITEDVIISNMTQDENNRKTTESIMETQQPIMETQQPIMETQQPIMEKRITRSTTRKTRGGSKRRKSKTRKTRY